MDTSSRISDLEGAVQCSYTPIPDQNPEIQPKRLKPLKSLIYTFSIILFVSVVMVLIGDHQRSETPSVDTKSASSEILRPATTPVSRGVSDGVSEKSSRLFSGEDDSFQWTNNMLSRQRTSNLFQPEQNWMNDPNGDTKSASSEILRPATTPVSRGVSEGVSEKSSRLFSGEDNSFQWTNNMLSWQRTSYHFQPEQNWMNDPNGPVFYNGWYHLFYQYNPEGAVWGNIVWGHAISKDMIHWLHLPLAMIPDEWYDINGVWTGSATILPDGSLVMLYTGSTNESVQVQNVAYPADPSDPLLVNWVKYAKNPVLVPPPGIGFKDFRDPTTAWVAPDGKWRITIGSKTNTTGISLVYETSDFINYTMLDGLLHAVQGTGMWECVDFYPVSKVEENGLDTSVNGPDVKHVLKASLDDDKRDYYSLGFYDQHKDTWTPDNPVLDVGIGLRYDYGKFYASKTFFDQYKQRRILWGWIGETDSERADVQKGWASLMGVPRTVTFDKKTKSNLLQWPVKEVESLRLNSKSFDNVKLEAGSVVPLDIDTATQIDITAEFEIDEKALAELNEADVEYNCSTSAGAAGSGALGPFGLLVLADDNRSEQTAVYFYIAKGIDGSLKTFFCTDQSRSSKANDVDKQIYGSTVPVLKGEKLSVRILVDHSIVEAFAQGGRTCITSRVYPTEAIYGASRVFLFNNATGVSVTTSSVKIWEMNSAFIRPYNFSAAAEGLSSLYVLVLIISAILVNMFLTF